MCLQYVLAAEKKKPMTSLALQEIKQYTEMSSLFGTCEVIPTALCSVVGSLVQKTN